MRAGRPLGSSRSSIRERPRTPEERLSRLLGGARLRRLMVYAIAGVMVLYAATTAVRLARPPDPYGPIRIEALPGAPASSGMEPTKVTYDAKTGQTVLEVTGDDGSVRRYGVSQEGGDWRVYSVGD